MRVLRWNRGRRRGAGKGLARGLALLLCAALVLVACGRQPGSAGPGSAGPVQERDGPPADQQVLRLLTLNMPRSLDPIHIDAQRITSDGLAESLIVLNDDATLRPALARSWRNVEPTLWEFELQPNVTFWSGAPMDGTAVVAALERHQKQNRRIASQLTGVAFSAPDPLKVQARTPQPDPSLPFRLTGLAIHNAAAAERLGDRFNMEADLTGSMKPVQFIPGELLISERHPGYWGEKPKLQRIESRTGTDAQARLLALKAGEADADMNIEVDQRRSYEQDKTFRLYFSPGGGTTRNLWLNHRRVPALQDLRVRQALDVGTDRQELITGVNRGYAGPATGHFPKALPYAVDTASTLDRERAKRLLDEAGWKPGQDGVRVKDGQRLHFKVLTYTYWQPTAVALQSQWKQIGVSTELTPVEQTASNQVMYDGNFDIATYCSCGAATGDIAGQLRSYYRSGIANNFGGYSNPEVDRLLDELMTEFDEKKQHDLARRVQRLLQQDVAMIYLYDAPRGGAAYHNRVRGIDPNQHKTIVPGMYIAK
jgi:peptide/nickel transport system substrate-binding protein